MTFDKSFNIIQIYHGMMQKEVKLYTILGGGEIMKMKPIIKASWNLENIANKASSQMGPMVGIGSQFCCAC